MRKRNQMKIMYRPVGHRRFDRGNITVGRLADVQSRPVFIERRRGPTLPGFRLNPRTNYTIMIQ